jgi:hypothetical protein
MIVFQLAGKPLAIYPTRKLIITTFTTVRHFCLP